MRTLMKVSIPVATGNQAVKDGSLPRTVMAFVERMKPESCYFSAEQGMRTAYFVFELEDPTQIPVIAEPFFMNLQASIALAPAMNLEEMRRGVEEAVKLR